MFDVARRAAGATASFTYPDDDPNAYARRQPAQPLGRRPRRDARGHRRPPAPGRPVDRPRRSRAAARTVELFRSQGELLRARGRGVVGRRDDRDAARTGASRSRRATCSRVGAPTTRARASWYESMGDHAGRDHRRAEPAAPTRSRPTSTVAGDLTHGHLRRERPPRRRAGRPARRDASCPTAPADDHGRDQGLPATARATCRCSAARACRRSSAPGQPLTFVNARRRAATICHTITACTRALQPRRPASRTRWPTAHGRASTPASSASARPRFTAAANRKTWQTPTDLRRGHLHVLLPHPPVHARRRSASRADRRRGGPPRRRAAGRRPRGPDRRLGRRARRPCRRAPCAGGRRVARAAHRLRGRGDGLRSLGPRVARPVDRPRGGVPA